MISKHIANKTIILNKYPNLKIGFTTANFAKALPPTRSNVKEIIDYASEQGFTFIELRDPNAALALDECKELADWARQKCIEVIYAVNVGGMDPKYFETFARAVANTLAFEGPKMIRTGANGPEMTNDEKKQYWTAEDFSKLKKNINKAANMARMFGISLSVENAREGLQGDGIQTFGTGDLFGKNGVNENVAWQLDTANFFSVSRDVSDSDAVKTFFEQHIERVDYTHLKSAKDGKSHSILGENTLPLELYLDVLSKKNKVYVAIELSPAEELETIYENHKKSIAYLIEKY
ncbi:sugar phosphate isomerase/epimerase family protein [Pelosinus propionicus]|uniref:Sugar phosphate isomerase/epimerase n=1 Tax=Pelosinus propionicus DSM 13327 TaxID=1123291 RepID=A0A1I4L5K1_9FIRM|nr:TIM barrel protein [Pelosinus propionicus]SFL86083.1 Sugar phosphate isomerase/epimerase [Pelosinus propionicus DSM 13327]